MTSYACIPHITEDAACVCLRSRAEVAQVVAPVSDAMERLGYSSEDVFAVRLALEEALVNAVKHGNGDDPSRQVQMRFQVTPRYVVAEVEDEGPGFDPTRVADPLSPQG